MRVEELGQTWPPFRRAFGVHSCLKHSSLYTSGPPSLGPSRSRILMEDLGEETCPGIQMVSSWLAVLIEPEHAVPASPHLPCPASHGFSLRFQLARGFGVVMAQQLDEAYGQRYPNTLGSGAQCPPPMHRTSQRSKRGTGRSPEIMGSNFP